MNRSSKLDIPQGTPLSIDAAGQEAVYPQVFSSVRPSRAAAVYLSDPAARKLVEFFEAKGLRAIKQEDQREQWYEDWLAYQAAHKLYATLLSPRQYSTLGSQFDLLRFTRFLEVFAYFSPAHGYSLQVTFLGLFSILMGSTSALKQEAVAALEAGGLLALGISEKSHGSDLFGNEFNLRETDEGRLVANGTKYYIGNSNSASIISILARKEDARRSRAKRAPFVLFALRPTVSPGFRSVRKISTLGVRSAFVGEFEVKDHPLDKTDLIAEGRDAWEAVFGTVTLGKFFLGFGSIGICERASQEAFAHLTRRILYGKPAIALPHIRSATAQAYARLTAMKLYAYRALDYVHAASAADRRYLLFNAVQKAKVSTEGVRVMALLSECMGAKGLESDTYFEMALRDAQLIPGLEGSAHINLALTAQFIPRYFAHPDPNLIDPKSLIAGDAKSGENSYLMECSTSATHTIAFPHFLNAYEPLLSIPNVRLFSVQAKRFALCVHNRRLKRDTGSNTEIALAVGQCLAIIAYGQLIAENSARLGIAPPIVSAIFHLLVCDLSQTALIMASSSHLDAVSRILIRRLITIPKATSADWEFVSTRVATVEQHLPTADPTTPHLPPPPVAPSAPASESAMPAR